MRLLYSWERLKIPPLSCDFTLFKKPVRCASCNDLAQLYSYPSLFSHCILIKDLLHLLFVMTWFTCILHNKHHTLSSDFIFKKSLLHLLICIDLAHLNFHMYIIHFHLILLFKRTCYVCYACKNFEHSQAKQCEQGEDYCLVGIFRLL